MESIIVLEQLMRWIRRYTRYCYNMSSVCRL